MCHPGRPAPQGATQLGSPGLAFFQRTKSSGERLSSSASIRAPARSDARAYRLLVLRSHYRSPIEVTPETVAQA